MKLGAFPSVFRYLFLTPLVIYAALTPIAAIYHFLTYHDPWPSATLFGFHPDALFPFEMIGLTLCFIGWRLTK